MMMKEEHEVRKEEKVEAENMMKSIVYDLVDDTPAKVEKIREERVVKKKQRALGRLMIGELVSNLVKSIPGLAAASMVMENVMNDVGTVVDRNMVWNILEHRKDIQEWVSWRIMTQNTENAKKERMKIERLRRAKMLQEELSRMDWSENMEDEDIVTEIEMDVDEMEEHSALEKLMKELDIDIEEMETSDNDDDFAEEIEHEFLDKILQELEDLETAWISAQRLEDAETDECIKTYSCTGDCTVYCKRYASDNVQPSTVQPSREKTVQDNVKLSPEVSECIISVHCAGDCTCVQQGTPRTDTG